MKYYVVGGLQMVVLSFEFHQNRLRGFGAVGGVEICPSPLTWPLAYRPTTACTTVVQAVSLYYRSTSRTDIVCYYNLTCVKIIARTIIILPL